MGEQSLESHDEYFNEDLGQYVIGLILKLLVAAKWVV